MLLPVRGPYEALAIVAFHLLVLMCSSGSFAYSVVAHEEIIDLLWTDAIRTLLL